MNLRCPHAYAASTELPRGGRPDAYGEKVFPEEVEEVIKRHPKVRDAAVVGLSDAKWGQAVTAIVEPCGAEQIDEEEIRKLVRNTLAGYKVPKRVFSVTTLGRSPAGKMDYKAVTETARRPAGLALAAPPFKVLPSGGLLRPVSQTDSHRDRES